MESEPNKPIIDWKNNEQKRLSLAISYEAELMVPSDLPLASLEKEGDRAAAMGLDPLIDAEEDDPVVTDTLMAPIHKEKTELEVRESHVYNVNEEPVGNDELLPIRTPDEIVQGEAKAMMSAPETDALGSGKCKERHVESTDTPSRAIKKVKLGDSPWEDLVSQVLKRLGAMNPDECVIKASDIAVRSRQHVESRSQYHVNIFDTILRTQTSTAPLPCDDALAQIPPGNLEYWMEKYTELKHFYQSNGHCEAPPDEDLGKWIQYQRIHVSSLDSTQLYLLTNVGLILGSNEASGTGDVTDPTDNMCVQHKALTESSVYTQHSKSLAKTNARAIQLRTERGVSTQKQVKTHRTTRFRTVEAVPSLKMTPPLPPNPDNHQGIVQALLPNFQGIVNFPNSRYAGKCVMCDESEYPIPCQNKGVCNNCDSAVWIFVENGLQIKWCKGCKNFKKWLDFGAKVSVI